MWACVHACGYTCGCVPSVISCVCIHVAVCACVSVRVCACMCIWCERDCVCTSACVCPELLALGSFSVKPSAYFLLWPGHLRELSWDRCVPALEQGAGLTPQPLLHCLGHPQLSSLVPSWCLRCPDSADSEPALPPPPLRSPRLPQAPVPSDLQISLNILKITLDGTLESRTLLLTSGAGRILVECLLFLDTHFPKV